MRQETLLKEHGVMVDQNYINVILINGNRIQSEYIETLFDSDKYRITKFFDGDIAYKHLLSSEDLSVVVIISYQLANINGLEIMQKLRDNDKEYAFIFLTADKTVERAVEAMKSGALDFIPKTSDLEMDLIPLVDKAYRIQQTKLTQQRIKKELDEKNMELAKLSVVARETDNAVAIFNSDLELEWINESFIEIYGYTKEEFIQTFGLSIIQSNPNPNITNLIQKCIVDKTPVAFTSDYKTKTGETIWVQSNISPVLDDEGNIIKLVNIDSDITELKKAESKILKQKKNITDSINYAKRIQTSILPDEIIIKKLFDDAFILFSPKDMVSGDFPWVFRNDNYTYLAAVDCTGHGVPGALLSFLGHFNLNNIVDHNPDLNSGKILDMLHLHVREALRQEQSKSQMQDGMDIAFCRIDFSKMEISFSGARRPLYYLHNTELTVIKGDKRSIGGMIYEKTQNGSFASHTVPFQKGDRLFIFSDGLQDQLNENDSSKFSSKRIVNTIIENYNLPLNNIKELFLKEYTEWKGTRVQLDDVLLMGVQL